MGGVRELVGNTGILVPPNNPKTLAEAMLRIMRMPGGERAQIGQSS